MKKSLATALGLIILVLFSQVSYAGELILWNKLGSQEEVENSEVGPNGFFDNAEGQLSFESSVYGGGVRYPFYEQHGSSINKIAFDLNSTGLTSGKGTIEFWWTAGFTDNTYFGNNGYRIFLFSTSTLYHPPNPPNTLNSCIYFVNDNYLATRKDVKFGVVDDGYYVETAGTAPTVQNFNENETMHFALVFDNDGINSGEETLMLFKNGVMIASGSEAYAGFPIECIWLGVGAGTYYKQDVRNLGYCSAAGVYDNLKIWNYAKTDFSDRFNEAAGTVDVFVEDYEGYQVGSDPNVVSNWHVYGLEQTGKSIQGDAQNKVLNISFNSPAGNIPPAWAPIVIAQDTAWSPAEDLSNTKIKFGIETDLAQLVPSVIAVEIFAVCNETGTVKSFRLPDANLLDIPSVGDGQVNYVIDISELTYNESAWATPDLTQVEKVQILFLQTVTDIVASGNIKIDNFKAVGLDTSQTITLIEENYNSYSIGSDPNLSSDWFVFGLERLSQVVQGANGDNWVDIAFSSPSGVAPAWCSFGLAQLEAWTTLKDFTDATIKIDIRTDLSQSVSNVMALEVFAVCNETGLVESFRIPDANLIALPSSAEGWVNIEVDISDLTYNENTWKTPDYSQIEKIQVLFLQTATDIVATGTVSIDNFKVEKSAQ